MMGNPIRRPLGAFSIPRTPAPSHDLKKQRIPWFLGSSTRQPWTEKCNHIPKPPQIARSVTTLNPIFFRPSQGSPVVAHREEHRIRRREETARAGTGQAGEACRGNRGGSAGARRQAEGREGRQVEAGAGRVGFRGHP